MLDVSPEQAWNLWAVASDGTAAEVDERVALR
jgi:hypothetical protein